MELTPLRNAIVGVPGVSGLSVEQRKRLTIGVELVANPSIVFMVWPPYTQSLICEGWSAVWMDLCVGNGRQQTCHPELLVTLEGITNGTLPECDDCSWLHASHVDPQGVASAQCTLPSSLLQMCIGPEGMSKVVVELEMVLAES